MLPDSIPSSLWEEFRLHRKKLRAPMTDHAETLILVKLEKWRIESGANPIDVLNESMERGWRGVFLNGHGKLSQKESLLGTGSPMQMRQSNACSKCGRSDWTHLDRYRICERCQ